MNCFKRQKLPNPDKAVITVEKLSGYCLNPEHQDGQHKAKIFQSALHLGADDSEILRTALMQAVRDYPAVPSKQNEYGQKYIIILR